MSCGKDDLGLPCVLIYLLALYLVLVWSWFKMPEMRLFIRVRKQGSRIESVPLKQLVDLSAFPKRSWSFKDGWLILEGEI